MQMTPMTIQGSEKLKKELEQLKKVERPKVIEAIAEARAHGDLKENAEFHAAKERQGFIEGRIREIESKLSHARIIDITQIENNGKVVFGSTVTLRDVDASAEVTYQIVGEEEADLKYHKISVTSPVARAVIGHSEGDEVVVQSPKGEIVYEIMQVAYV